MHWRMTILMLMLCGLGSLEAADIIIKLPPDFNLIETGVYRLDYSPPIGVPAPNTTFQPSDIANGTIALSQALPGTKYNLTLNYTNATISNHPFFSERFTTTPDPPSNITHDLLDAKAGTVVFRWMPPSIGEYTHYKLHWIPVNDVYKHNLNKTEHQVTENEMVINLNDLLGGTYEIQVYTMYEGKASQDYISTNLTKVPLPGVYYKSTISSEFTIKIILNNAYPLLDYEVSIYPPDANVSKVFVPSTESDQFEVSFLGLFPGREYNITIKALSKGAVLEPYNFKETTLPLEPSNFTVDSVSPNNFTVSWSSGETEFDHYQVAIRTRIVDPQIIQIGPHQLLVYDGTRLEDLQIIERGQSLKATFMTDIEPGNTYQVVVRTISDGMESSHVDLNITTQPLPVLDLKQDINPKTGELTLMWKPDPASKQDGYRIEYIINDATMSVNNTVNIKSSPYVIQEPNFFINDVQPGINYTISVKAVSNGIESSGRIVHRDVPRL